MRELDDTIRAAADGAASATVAPPFGTVSRRAAARRHRQVAGVAGSAVVMLAAGVLAILGPGREAAAPAAPGALKPFGELHSDPAAVAAVRDCLVRRPTVRTQQGPPLVYHRAQAVPCLAAQGYEPPPPGAGANVGTLVIVPDGWVGQVMSDGGDTETEGNTRCWETPEPGKDVRTLATGRLTGLRWYVVAWTGDDGARCVGFQLTPRGEPLTPDSDLDSGPDGALRPFLAWDFFKEPDGSRPVLWWGAVSPEVARVEFVVGGRKQSFPTIDGGDRRYVALLLDVPKGARTTGPVGYDAQGRRVPLPDS